MDLTGLLEAVAAAQALRTIVRLRPGRISASFMRGRPSVTASIPLRLDIGDDRIRVHDLAFVPDILRMERAVLEALSVHLVMEVSSSTGVIVLDDSLLGVATRLNGLDRAVPFGGRSQLLVDERLGRAQGDNERSVVLRLITRTVAVMVFGKRKVHVNRSTEQFRTHDSLPGLLGSTDIVLSVSASYRVFDAQLHSRR